MKKLILVSILCLYSTVVVLSQTKDQIVLNKKRFYLNEKQLNNKELKTLLKSQQESAYENTRQQDLEAS